MKFQLDQKLGQQSFNRDRLKAENLLQNIDLRHIHLRGCACTSCFGKGSHPHRIANQKNMASAQGQPFETLAFFNNNGGRYKWSQPNGAGSPVNITYALGQNFRLDGLSQGQTKTLFQEALGVWAEVAPLNFREIRDPGTDQAVDIRVKSDFIDGNSNTLAFAFFPQGGDITFDSGESSWSPSLFLETAVHEIGHALGLGHDDQVDAIMNSRIMGRYNGPGTAFLLQDDIRGIRSLYGSGVGSVTTLGQSSPTTNPTVNLVRGNSNNNLLSGTNQKDKLVGLGGNDTLRGRGKNDELLGGDGRDRLQGGSGNDKLFGNQGRDRLVGDRGNDVLVGGLDKDTLIGAKTSDQQPGIGEKDRLRGGADADLFILGTAKTVFYKGNNTADYVLIEDFNPRQGDRLQLKGKASQYALGATFRNVPSGLTLSQGQGADRELIAVIRSPRNFTLNGNTVRFV